MQEDFVNKIFTSHFIARVRKGYVGFYCERELETEHNRNILTPHSYGRHVVSFLFSWCSTRGLGAHSAGWSAAFYLDSRLYRGSWGTPRSGVAFPTTSRLQLVWHSTGNSRNSSGPKGPFGLMWLSLPHLASNCLEPSGRNSTQLYNRSTPTRSLKSNV